MANPVAEPVDEHRWGLGRFLTVAVVLVLVVFWIWVFTGGPEKKNPDYLKDRDWAKAAEATCAATQEQIKALPGAETSPDNVARAKVVDQANDLIEAMLDHLRLPPPDNAGDARLVKVWLVDYHDYLTSRREYAAKLATDRQARLLLNEKFSQPIDDVITTFADVNHLQDCEAPGDVG